MRLTPESLSSRYTAVRRQSLAICQPLATEDYVIQPMEDASPPKWHLAHVTWFFETFLLKPYYPDYVPFDENFEVLFNSYYNGVGEPFPRSERGRLSRPTVATILEYRSHVDDAMQVLLEREMNDEVRFRIVLGLNHEQQHQELLFTDLKYNLGNNPLYPAYLEQALEPAGPTDLEFEEFGGGVYEIGASTETRQAFAFDNESPRHEVLLRDFAIANRLVTNGEYLAFMNDGGYERPELWLSDAWSRINDSTKGFTRPLYWVQREGRWFEYTLGGLRPLELNAPVCHVSGYEADAYARWSDSRLPTEPEWEVMASPLEISGNFVESGKLHPSGAKDVAGLRQVYGDTWEWTQSSYAAYPGFRAFGGELGEYNGKFMANQLVLRGGSCVTPKTHIRDTYRNFFYPGDRWQFSGIRLARDCNVN
ncbi:MAG: ergothioneine biosynthesis protein EgtB [Pseudomonadales bacterium]